MFIQSDSDHFMVQKNTEISLYFSDIKEYITSLPSQFFLNLLKYLDRLLPVTLFSLPNLPSVGQ